MGTTTILVITSLILFIASIDGQACYSDHFEPNDDPASATIIANATRFQDLNLTLCNPTDIDYFRVVAPSDGHFDFSIFYYLNQTNYGGNLGMMVMNTNTSANYSMNNIYYALAGVQVNVQKGDVLLFWIYPLPNSEYLKYRPRYVLFVDFLLGVVCPKNATNLNPTTAIEVPIGGRTYQNQSLCLGLENWFKFTIYENFTINIVASWLDELLSTIYFDLYSSDARTLVKSVRGLNPPQILTMDLTPGLYYLNITQDTGLTWTISSYQISFSTGPGPSSSTTLTSSTTPTSSSTTTSTSSSITSASTTPPSNQVDPASIQSASGGSNAIAIALGIVGGLIFIAIIAVVLVFLYLRGFILKNRRDPQLEESPPSVPMLNLSPVTSPGPSAQTIYPVVVTTGFVQPEVNLKKNYIIDYRDLEDLNAIGKGSFGIVYRGKWRETVVAVKQLLGDLDMDEKAMADFTGEANILSQLRPHPNVVLFLGITAPPQPLTIVTEFCVGGSLWSVLCSSAVLTVEMQKKLLLGIARGMLHLHSENIIHRDLAARNVLLTESFEPKVADFGLSRHDQSGQDSNKTKSGVGPLKWMPPEAIREKIYSTQSDVWSFGVVMWEITCRSEPWPELDAVKAAMGICYENLRLVPPDACDATLRDLMMSCWNGSPHQRPSMKDICTVLAREVSDPGSRESMMASGIPSSQGGSSGGMRSTGVKSFNSTSGSNQRLDTPYGAMEMSSLGADGSNPFQGSNAPRSQPPSSPYQAIHQGASQQPTSPSNQPMGTYGSIDSAAAFKK